MSLSKIPTEIFPEYSLKFIIYMFKYFGIFRSLQDCKHMQNLIKFFQNEKSLERASQKSEKSFLEELINLFVEKQMLKLMFEFLGVNIQIVCFNTEIQFNIVLPLGSTVKELEISIIKKIYDKDGHIAKNIRLIYNHKILDKDVQLIYISGKVYLRIISHGD